MSSSGHYIHGSDADEQRRLSLLNELMNSSSLTALALGGGERVLDVGSGLGQLARAMARQVGLQGAVIGVERDTQQLEKARRLADAEGEAALVDFRSGDALRLPLEPAELGSFDVAHARFVLEHVRDPLGVVRAMLGAVRPGGRIVLEDDDHDVLRMWPAVPAVESLWSAYIETYTRLGNDPFVGRRLVALLVEAGATPVRNRALFFGSCDGDPNFGAFVTNFLGVLEGARAQVVDAGLLDGARFDEGLAALREWRVTPGAALWYVTCWAEGRREAGPTAPAAPTPEQRPVAAAVRQLGGDRLTALRFLSESARDLTSSLSLDEVFEKIAARVRELASYQLFCVMLWNESAGLLEHSYSLRNGVRERPPGGFPLGYGLSGSAAAARRPLRVADVSRDPRYVRYRHAEVEVRSELAVPLLVKDRLVGVLDLESTELDAFTAEHEELLSALAAHMAIALDNARLYAEVKSNEARMDDDLATGRKIQERLLTRPPPALPGFDIGTAFAPARDLSGDFYDFLPYRDGRFGLAVGDVAGKATAAALYGSLALGFLRGQALERCPAPAAMLEQLDRELRSLRIPNRFLALLFGVLDPGTRAIELACAGIPAPFLARAGRVERVAVRGVALGLQLGSARFEPLRLELEPGDVLLISSDGLQDSMKESGELFGSERVAALLAATSARPAAAIAAELIAATDAFAGAAHGARDDRTAVVLKVDRG